MFQITDGTTSPHRRRRHRTDEDPARYADSGLREHDDVAQPAAPQAAAHLRGPQAFDTDGETALIRHRIRLLTNIIRS